MLLTMDYDVTLIDDCATPVRYWYRMVTWQWGATFVIDFTSIQWC